MYLKCTQTGLQIDSKCIINVQKMKYTTIKDDNRIMFTSEKQIPSWKISGIEMRPCEKKPVEMCAKTTKYVLKMY